MRHQSAILLALGVPAAASIGGPIARSPSDQSLTQPKVTNVAEMVGQQYLGKGISPRPTEAPNPFGRMLKPRLDGYTLGPGTCGYLAVDSISITCNIKSATCTGAGNYMGCCVPNQDCNIIKTTCLNYQASVAGQCNLPNDYHTLCCTDSASGLCNTWIATTSDGSGNSHKFTLLNCQPTIGSINLVDYDPKWAATHIFPSTTSSASSRGSQTSSSATNSPSTGSDGSDDNTSNKKKSSSNVGAIAGGVVGGVVALALIGAAVFLFSRRGSKKNKESPSQGSPSTYAATQHNPQSPPPMSQSPVSPGGAAYPSGVPSSYQPSGYPPQGSPQQGYDPHMSAYGQPPYQQQGFQTFPPGQHPQQQYGAYPPQHQQEYPQGGAYAYGQQPPSTASPPPHTTPSPIPHTEAGIISPGSHGPTSPVSELAAVNPVGNENNRAELGGH